MEGFGFFFLGIICIIADVLMVSFIAAIGGLIGFIVNRNRRDLARIFTIVGIVGGAMLCVVGGGLYLVREAIYRPSYGLDDEVLKPYISALDSVDRNSLGFTSIQEYARIEIEYAFDGRAYDVMLHVYADTSRTIAYQKIEDSYIWIGEQEIYYGPNEYTTSTGKSKEQIAVTYETVRISGVPLNAIDISYIGDDPRLKMNFDLTIDDIEFVLEEWRDILPTPTPWR